MAHARTLRRIAPHPGAGRLCAGSRLCAGGPCSRRRPPAVGTHSRALIREAAGTMQPGKTPPAFVELLFDHTTIEDLANYDAASLAFLAEQAWEHVQRRTAGNADIRVINPMMPDGREISVLEVLNDNMPFLFDSTMAELAEQGIEVTLVAHPVIAVERDEQGKLLRFYDETLTEGVKGERESLIHFHIARLDADSA